MDIKIKKLVLVENKIRKSIITLNFLIDLDSVW